MLEEVPRCGGDGELCRMRPALFIYSMNNGLQSYQAGCYQTPVAIALDFPSEHEQVRLILRT